MKEDEDPEMGIGGKEREVEDLHKMENGGKQKMGDFVLKGKWETREILKYFAGKVYGRLYQLPSRALLFRFIARPSILNIIIDLCTHYIIIHKVFKVVLNRSYTLHLHF